MVEHVHGVDDNCKLHAADEPAEGALDVRKTDNIEQVGRLALPGTTDMQFQRRTGDDLILDGEPYQGEYLDLAVAGGMSGPNGVGSGVCKPPADGRDGGPPLNGEGVHIFDITDPANPVLVRFLRQGNDVPRGPHNITVNVDDGLLYFSFQALGGTPYFGYFDLKDLSSAPVYWQMRSIDSQITAVDSCHDIGLAHGFVDALGNERDLLFCAAVTGTYIWDIADPTAPQPVSKIFNRSSARSSCCLRATSSTTRRPRGTATRPSRTPSAPPPWRTGVRRGSPHGGPTADRDPRDPRHPHGPDLRGARVHRRAGTRTPGAATAAGERVDGAMARLEDRGVRPWRVGCGT